MPNRYNKSKILNDENGIEYLNRIEYPPIPIRERFVVDNRTSKQSIRVNLYDTWKRISCSTKCKFYFTRIQST